MATYYVATTGSDSNAGTSALPFLTIQHAADIVVPGDTVIVKDGTYISSDTQIFTISRGGAVGNHVVFKSEHKWGAVLSGQSGATMYPIQFSSSASYIDIFDFEMRDFHKGIWANDTSNPSNFITLKGNKIHDFGRNLIDGGGTLYVGNNHHDWIITKNMFYNIGSTSTTATLNLDHAIYVTISAPTEIETPYNFEISYNIIWGCSGDAIQAGFHHSKIINNTFAWSNENSAGGRGFLVTDSLYGGKYITVANNIFYQALTYNSYSLRAYSGVEGWSVSNNMVYGGRMWYEDTPSGDITTAMTGENYGLVDCEHAEVNPLVIYALRTDAINANFQLQSTSPAINKGIDVGLTSDYLGNSIIGLPDIGAYEYQGTATTTTTTTAAPTTSTIYYVATTGNDSNAGTSVSPFLTIQHAADIVNPGDTVIVKNGVYTSSNEQVISISRGGASGSHIIFKSENKWGAILDGQSGATTYPIQFSSSASYVDVLDFEMRNFHRGIWANDASNPSNFITLKGNKLHDFGRNTVDGGGTLYVGRSHHDWVVTKNMFYNIGNINTSLTWNLDHAIYVTITAPTEAETPYNFEISYNIIWGCSGDAIQVGFHHSKIVNNTFAWSNENTHGGRGFIVTDSPTTYGGRYITVANNIFYQALTSGSYSIRSYSGVTGWSVSNNMVYGGRMWYEDTSSGDIAAAMAGGNYGQIDCENGEVNPLLVYAVRSDAINADFRLQTSSPAINRGIDVGLTSDYLNNPIVGLPDIGAYEYQSITTTTTTTTGVPTSTTTTTRIVSGYYNVEMRLTFTRNNCPPNYTTSPTTYIIPAEMYHSYISQDDANYKAVHDLTENGQNYANEYGICTQEKFFYNDRMTSIKTKHCCPVGYHGSQVTYVVCARTHKSFISKEDANDKALADIAANAQIYADNRGCCIACHINYCTRGCTP